MNALMTWLNGLPSTNARIAASLVVYFATAVRYLVWGSPGDGWGEWLTLIGALAGLDVAQFAAKRATAKAEIIAATRESQV